MVHGKYTPNDLVETLIAMPHMDVDRRATDRYRPNNENDDGDQIRNVELQWEEQPSGRDP